MWRVWWMVLKVERRMVNSERIFEWIEGIFGGWYIKLLEIFWDCEVSRVES